MRFKVKNLYGKLGNFLGRLKHVGEGLLLGILWEFWFWWALFIEPSWIRKLDIKSWARDSSLLLVWGPLTIRCGLYTSIRHILIGLCLSNSQKARKAFKTDNKQQWLQILQTNKNIFFCILYIYLSNIFVFIYNKKEGKYVN